MVALRRSITWRCWKEEEITIQAIKNVAGAAFSSTPQSFVFLWLLLCHRREMALAALNVYGLRAVILCCRMAEEDLLGGMGYVLKKKLEVVDTA